MPDSDRAYSVFFLSKNLKKGDGCMKNPVAIYTKPDEDFVMISGFVKSVVDQGSYNSVSFKVDSEASGITELISVMCFDNPIGINFKKLVANSKGRFMTVFAVARPYDKGISYAARAISIAPHEFVEKPAEKVAPVETPVEEPEYEQLSFDLDDIDTDSIPF